MRAGDTHPGGWARALKAYIQVEVLKGGKGATRPAWQLQCVESFLVHDGSVPWDMFALARERTRPAGAAGMHRCELSKPPWTRSPTLLAALQ